MDKITKLEFLSISLVIFLFCWHNYQGIDIDFAGKQHHILNLGKKYKMMEKFKTEIRKLMFNKGAKQF